LSKDPSFIMMMSAFIHENLFFFALKYFSS